MPLALTIRVDRIRGIARSVAALLFLAGSTGLPAQSAPCGITSVTETSQLVYPRLAQLAHVGGDVILLARFDQNGTPIHVQVLSAPPMLQNAALEFVKGWRANEDNVPRECQIAINFKVISGDKPVCSYEEADPPEVTRADVQHVSISVQSISTCDPTTRIPKT